MAEPFMAYHSDPLVREYQDRGMAKWLGFYLSEHTAEMTNEKQEREQIWRKKTAMTATEISEVLYQAYIAGKQVSLQINMLNVEGQPLPDITGTIAGLDEENLYLFVEQDLQVIAHDTVGNVELALDSKWSDVS